MSNQQDLRSLHAQASEHALRFDFSARSRIEVKGPDAATFLHNLCTNDTKSLAPGQGCEAFFCTNKAKVIAHVHVSRLPDTEPTTFYLDAVPGQNEVLYSHLNRYLISEQVELTDITSNWSQILIVGREAPPLVTGTLGLPIGDMRAWGMVRLPSSEGYIRRRVDLSMPAFELWVPRENASQQWQRLDALATATEEVLDLLRLEAGTPVFARDIDTERFVAEVNRTAQAISYTKGCYLGQEPIVMARDRGHLNRLLLGLTSDDEEPLVPGSKVFAGELEVGHVTSSAYSPRIGKTIALAYLKRGHWDAGAAMTVFPPSTGHAVVVSSLPFVGDNVDM